MIKARTNEFWKTTIALSIGSMLVFANIYFTQPILPVIAEEFQVSPLAANMTVSLVILALGLSLFIYGPFSDSVGRRRIMIITMVLATVTTFLAAFAPTFELLVIIRVLQGIFLAGLPSIAIAYISEEYSIKAIPLAIGFYISGNTIGGMFGRAISGILTDIVNWRFAFIAMGFVSVICLFIFIWLLQPSKRFVKKEFNWKETYRTYQSHIVNRQLRYAYLVGGLLFMIFVGHFSYVSFLLSSPPFELSSSIIGLLFLTYIAGTISSQLSGKLALRLPKSVCIQIGVIIMVCGFLLTTLESVTAIVCGLFINCFGFFFAHSSASSWVSLYATSAKASASGLYLIFYYIGGSLGPFYLEPFWGVWHWQGIIVGSVLILIITAFFVMKMMKIETHKIQENVMIEK